MRVFFNITIKKALDLATVIGRLVKALKLKKSESEEGRRSICLNIYSL
jgi:hypothetical protein